MPRVIEDEEDVGVAAAGSHGALPGLIELQRFDRYALWKDFVHDNFPWLEHRCPARTDFRAAVHTSRLADCAFAFIRASASEVIRTRHLAEVSEAGLVKMFWQTAGRMEIEQDGRTCPIAPGDVAVCDTARPYRIRLTDGAAFAVLMFPYAWIQDWTERSRDVCATRLSQRFSARAAIGAALANAGHVSEPVSVDQDIAIRSLQRMLSGAIGRSHGQTSPPTSTADDERFDRAKQIIHDQIGNPGLSADDLAASLCMSRRALYLLFERHCQTPCGMIRDLRLDRVAAALQGPLISHAKITALAFDFGFSDYATFSRLFRQRFGQAPRKFREARWGATVGIH